MRTHILCVGQDTIAARLTAKCRGLDHKLRTLEGMGQRRPAIDPTEDRPDRFLHKAALPNLRWREQVPERIYCTIHGPRGLERLSRTWLVHIESGLRRVCQFFCKLFPARREDLAAFDDPAHMLGFV